MSTQDEVAIRPATEDDVAALLNLYHFATNGPSLSSAE
jgi:hypothetical protein